MMLCHCDNIFARHCHHLELTSDVRRALIRSGGPSCGLWVAVLFFCVCVAFGVEGRGGGALV